MVIAIVALIAALGGTAVAGGFITKKKAKNVANNQITKRQSGLSVLKAQTAGKADNVFWAVVADAGVGAAATLNRSSGGVTVSDGTGVNVNFGRNVTQCVWTATKGDVAAGVSTAGWAQTQQADGAAPNAVNVRTRDDAGTLDEQDFHLVVVC
ncbi:MAG: hypothetical protein ACXWZJ_10430 [Solirubrobacterales bacterium]